MLDFPFMLQVKLPVVNRIQQQIVDRMQQQSSKFAIGAENEATGDSNLNDLMAALTTFSN